MSAVQQDFQERVGEIEAFFALLDSIDQGDTLLLQKDTLVPVYTPNEERDLLRTCKASAFLLLYNLMESTVSNAVESIFAEMARQGIAFDSCSENVRVIILDNLKKHNSKSILSSIHVLSVDIVAETFRKNEIVSGNVDARAIRKIADDYGFVRPAADGHDLQTIKSNRNDLAHGFKSFAEVGRTFSMADVLRWKNQVVQYLTALIESVAIYLTQQLYLSCPGRP